MEVLAALKERNASRLARLVHPSRGVRFSPFAYVRSDSDVVIRPDSVGLLFTDQTRRVWGHSDGTGDPIVLTFTNYYERYVYDVDFAAAPRRAFDAPPIRSGNTPSNLRAAYPTARWIEFHFPGFDDRYGGMDWRSLWLVFEELRGRWFLVGVVHGSWTI
jgi:hypothetical protein